MKRLFRNRFLLGTLLGFFACVTAIWATQTLWLGSLTTITTSPFYSPTNAVQSFVLPYGTLSITVSNLTSTNSITNVVQISLDGTNFVSALTNQPTITNGTYSVAVGGVLFPLYGRLAIWTNTSQVGPIQMGGTLTQ